MNNIIIVLLAIIVVVQLLILLKTSRSSGEHNFSREFERLRQNQQNENLNQSTRIDGQLANVDRMLESNSKRSEAYMNQVFDIMEQNQEYRIQKLVKENNKLSEKITELTTVKPVIDKLNNQVADLESVLGDKKSRGSFGETQLYTIVQNYYGISDYVTKQTKLSTGVIVDLAINSIAHQKLLCIDSKFPLENYLKIVEDESYLKLFEKDVKKHINDIANKYIVSNETVNFALMFVPSESIYSEIVSNPQLVEYSNKSRVWFVSPSTVLMTIQIIENLAIDFIRQENTEVIESDINSLGVEFERFEKRYEQLEKHMKQVNGDINDITITSRKLTNKFAKIKNRKR